MAEAIDALADSLKPYRTDGTPNDSKSRIAAAKEVLNRAGIKGEDLERNKPTTINLFTPGWGTESGKDEVIEVVVENTP